MKVSDLVKINDLQHDDPRRLVGLVVRFDVYENQVLPARDETIAEVLWNGGHLSWILLKRLDVINTQRSEHECC